MKPRRFLFNLQTMLLVKAGRQHHTKENLSLALRDLILTVMEVQESPTDVSYQSSRFWCRMSQSLTFSPSSKSHHQTSPPQTKEGSCFTQEKSNTLSLRTAAVSRRHSADGMISSRSGRGDLDADRFHPYQRQFSDGAVTECLQQCSSSFSSLHEVCSPGSHSHSSDMPPSWDQYNGSIQNSYPELPGIPVDPPCFLSQSYPSYSSASPQQQVSSRLYPNKDQSSTSKYSLSSQSHQDDTTQSIFPKPIYSYSILIFMALKNSKTGSLPVSEIYSFMTEHFPYFKTAPDGWKNSVRHNLSLNKCFEKVENKNGSTSRKGCLWALNPAKVEKMQEELHKWRRKDPVTIRRSMAKPEDLDRLLGERPERLRSVPPNPKSGTLTRATPVYNPSAFTCTPAELRPACQPICQSLYAHLQPQQPFYLPPAVTHPSNSFALFSPCGQQPAAGIPSSTGSLNSPVAGKIPPVYNNALQCDYSVEPRTTMQEFLLEGDTTYDIDMLNPSLTDLQLQGNLWEELRVDSLVAEPQVSTSSSATFVPQNHHIQSSGLHVVPPISQTSAVVASGRCEAEYEDGDEGRNVEQHGCFNGLNPVLYSGVESLAGYLTSCTASVSLM
ncbi:forkhead box protein N1 isoform X1 [Astatotilapia calliptera]|uniref:Fork-head domain-containing protein n=1 Tax=Astatotilapia calliptera TaxID=8154 RepID=A0AAX7URJ3_ASTCA|nr:forkhead box protein N1 isoform X1 [Astatotilapia calliptera]